jgi:hypothetical protein
MIKRLQEEFGIMIFLNHEDAKAQRITKYGFQFFCYFNMEGFANDFVLLRVFVSWWFKKQLPEAFCNSKISKSQQRNCLTL